MRRTWRLAKLSLADSALVQLTISSGVPSLAKKGSRVLARPGTVGLAAILTTSAVLSALVLFQNRTAAQPRQDEPRPSPQAPPAARPSAQSRLPAKAAIQDDVPAPKELNAAAGRGKIQMYALDAEGNRMHPRSSRERRSHARRESHADYRSRTNGTEAKCPES